MVYDIAITNEDSKSMKRSAFAAMRPNSLSLASMDRHLKKTLRHMTITFTPGISHAAAEMSSRARLDIDSHNVRDIEIQRGDACVDPGFFALPYTDNPFFLVRLYRRASAAGKPPYHHLNIAMFPQAPTCHLSPETIPENGMCF